MSLWIDRVLEHEKRDLIPANSKRCGDRIRRHPINVRRDIYKALGYSFVDSITRPHTTVMMICKRVDEKLLALIAR